MRLGQVGRERGMGGLEHHVGGAQRLVGERLGTRDQDHGEPPAARAIGCAKPSSRSFTGAST